MATGGERPPNFRKSYGQYSTQLYDHLMEGYNKRMPPVSTRSKNPAADSLFGEGNYSDAGTDVALQVRFFKLETVAITTGSMRIGLWLREWWNDERLAWDPADFGNITEIVMDGPELEEPDIWHPDFRIYNAVGQHREFFDSVSSSVQANGDVFFSRPGMVEMLCKFSGLVAFPYDELSCEFEIGGWTLSGGQQGLFFRTDAQGHPLPFTLANTERTSGASYQEYTIKRVTAELETLFYDCCENSPWPVARYKVYLTRSSAFYKDTIIIPAMLLTIASFGVFFMSFEVGERLSYGITLILAVQVMQGTVSTFVPVSNELLWIDLFNLANLFFSYGALYETILVLFFGFFTDSHLLPAFLRSRRLEILCSHYFGSAKITPEIDKLRIAKRSMAGEYFRNHQAKLQRRRSLSGALPPERFLGFDDAERLVMFERIFFLVDSDSNGYMTEAQVLQLMSYLAMDLSDEEAKREFSRFDQDGNGVIAQSEFIRLCIKLLWRVPLPLLKLSAENYVEASANKKDRNKEYWMIVSKQIDHVARFVFPAAYTFTMLVFFSLDMTDDYENAHTSMFSGFGTIVVQAGKWWQIFLVPCLLFVLVLVWLNWKRLKMIKASHKKVKKVLTTVRTRDSVFMKSPPIEAEASNEEEASMMEDPNHESDRTEVMLETQARLVPVLVSANAKIGQPVAVSEARTACSSESEEREDEALRTEVLSRSKPSIHRDGQTVNSADDVGRRLGSNARTLLHESNTESKEPLSKEIDNDIDLPPGIEAMLSKLGSAPAAEVYDRV